MYLVSSVKKLYNLRRFKINQSKPVVYGILSWVGDGIAENPISGC